MSCNKDDDCVKKCHSIFRLSVITLLGENCTSDVTGNFKHGIHVIFCPSKKKQKTRVQYFLLLYVIC